MKVKRTALLRQNLRLTNNRWGTDITKIMLEALKALTNQFAFSVAVGDLIILDGNWYVTHSGLLRIAQRKKCAGIRTSVEKNLSNPISNRWVFKAVVYKQPDSKGFVGYGDADPTNVSPLVHGAEMRVAETRAVNRALRKAYGIGLCSVEEIGSSAATFAPPNGNGKFQSEQSVSNNGHHPLRDRLHQLIRRHRLDAALVKRYAVDFCGTESLRDAAREKVEDFINHLAHEATEDRAALLCRLNSYDSAKEANT